MAERPELRGRDRPRLPSRGFILALAAIFLWLLVESSYVSGDYAATCTKCLQRASIEETGLFGIVWHRRTSLRLPDERPGPMCISCDRVEYEVPDVPPMDPRIYDEIFGRPCDHAFQKLGGCRWEGVALPMQAVGGSGKGGWIQRNRNQPIEALFRAYRRTQQEELAKATYQVIDRLCPEGIVKWGHPEPRAQLGPMSLALSLVETAGEWRLVLSWAEGGFHGEPPLLSDRKLLLARKESTDPVVAGVAETALLRLDAEGDKQAPHLLPSGKVTSSCP